MSPTGVGVTLYFARHGESEANVARVFSNRDLPHRLTGAGIEHARSLARALSRYPIDELWCSPVPRSVETAEIVGSALGLEWRMSEGLREFDVGHYEGTASDDGWAEYATVMRAWLAGDLERRVGGGESLTEIVARMNEFLRPLTDEAHEGRHIALVGHGGLYRMALPYIFANISPEFAAGNAPGYGGLIVASARGGRLICSQWGEATVPN